MSANVRNPGELSRRQESAAVALAGGQTLAEAARTIGSNERTLRRWMALAAFRGRVRALRSEMTSQAVGKLADSMSTAADTMRGLLTATGEKGEHVRLSAARSVLEMGLKAIELFVLQEDLDSLKAEFEDMQRRSK